VTLQPAPLASLATTVLALALATGARAETLLHVDARAPVAAPGGEGWFRRGTATAPGGHTLGINQRYLVRDGHPWLPVMGELHYSRVPAARWEAELRKMKAAGIDIVSSYVLWDHHEAQPGRFDWQGDRDLRRFVRLCGQVGLDVVIRIGPWAHAEARFGGIPDWVVNAMPTRTSDPQYLDRVARLYGEIGRQLKGSLWKDGGPVVGIQIENEYNLTGPGQGAEHIRTLKGLARAAGLDVPLYTVTGWDGTVYPSGEVTPVFGSYPDEPWATSTTELPPKETYAFRFDSRVSGDLGAQTAATAPGTAETDKAHTPFLGAEYGAGLPAMYRRRTVVSAQDIAAMVPVQIGSGVNLLGWYMFHGGRNPASTPSLEESTFIGGYNDVPMISYDFQAPLGPDGQVRDVLAALRPLHYLLHDFGERLAPMTVRRPDELPAGPGDLATPRWSVRSQDDRAFLFVGNHVRQHPMPVQRQVRFAIDLPGGRVTLPSRPVDVPVGAAFVWPVGLDLDGTRLAYATAQPVARLDAGADGIVYVFAETPGVPVELAFDASARERLRAASGATATHDGTLVVSDIAPSTAAAIDIAAGTAPGTRRVRVLVLPEARVRDLSIGDVGGRRRLVLSAQATWFGARDLELSASGDAPFRFGVFPPLGTKARGSPPPKAVAPDGLFQVFEAAIPSRSIPVTIESVRPARAVDPARRGGAANAAMQPAPESYAAAAAWRLTIPRGATKGLGDALLTIDLAGDIARLHEGTRFVDDWYCNGLPWQIGLDRLGAATSWTLSVLPLRRNAPIYLPREARAVFDDPAVAQVALLRSVTLVPVRRWSVRP
jgi:hypothetical protein